MYWQLIKNIEGSICHCKKFRITNFILKLVYKNVTLAANMFLRFCFC